MSRSTKRTPIHANTTARSDKPFKVTEHRRYRVAIRITIARDADDMPHHKSTGNPWLAPKDGKRWHDGDMRLMRK